MPPPPRKRPSTELQRNTDRWAQILNEEGGVEIVLRQLKDEYPNVNSLPKVLTGIKTLWFAQYAPRPTREFLAFWQRWRTEHADNPHARDLIALVNGFLNPETKNYKLLDRFHTQCKKRSPALLSVLHGDDALLRSLTACPDPFPQLKNFRQDPEDQALRKHQSEVALVDKQANRFVNLQGHAQYFYQRILVDGLTAEDPLHQLAACLLACGTRFTSAVTHGKWTADPARGIMWATCLQYVKSKAIAVVPFSAPLLCSYSLFSTCLTAMRAKLWPLFGVSDGMTPAKVVSIVNGRFNRWFRNFIENDEVLRSMYPRRKLKGAIAERHQDLVDEGLEGEEQVGGAFTRAAAAAAAAAAAPAAAPPASRKRVHGAPEDDAPRPKRDRVAPVAGKRVHGAPENDAPRPKRDRVAPVAGKRRAEPLPRFPRVPRVRRDWDGDIIREPRKHPRDAVVPLISRSRAVRRRIDKKAVAAPPLPARTAAEMAQPQPPPADEKQSAPPARPADAPPPPPPQQQDEKHTDDARQRGWRKRRRAEEGGDDGGDAPQQPKRGPGRPRVPRPADIPDASAHTLRSAYLALTWLEYDTSKWTAVSWAKMCLGHQAEAASLGSLAHYIGRRLTDPIFALAGTQDFTNWNRPGQPLRPELNRHEWEEQRALLNNLEEEVKQHAEVVRSATALQRLLSVNERGDTVLVDGDLFVKGDASAEAVEDRSRRPHRPVTPPPAAAT